jgi:GntR family transcriptional regulator, histidine utilization repressor
VKDHILENIQSGTWAAGARVPSENELVESFGISRMTANRALRELAGDGYLARVPGVGTFVKAQPARTSLMELRNIAEEIAARGHKHTSRLITREKILSNRFFTEEFEWTEPQYLFHLVIVHDEDGLPVQLENRWVNPHMMSSNIPWKPSCPIRRSRNCSASPRMCPALPFTVGAGARARWSLLQP